MNSWNVECTIKKARVTITRAFDIFKSIPNCRRYL